MKIMYAVCGILFIIDGVYSMYITETKDIPPKPCNVIPASTSLPCTEFSISGRNSEAVASACLSVATTVNVYRYRAKDCNETRLKELFPHLYNRVDPDGAPWPGKIQNIESKNSSIEWTVTQDGSINYLKGFQVIQSGSKFQTFGSKLCSIIDLSKMAKSDLNLLLKTKFYINNEDAGSYRVNVKPLPFPSEDVQSTGVTISMEANKTFSVYHPDMRVKVDYFQVNATTVNISVNIGGEKTDITSMEIWVFNQNGDYLPNAPTEFDINQETFVINDLQEGNYTLKLTPIDPFSFIDNTCLCYFGTEDSRQCTPCIGYTTPIRVEEWTDTFSKPSWTVRGVVPVSSMGLG